MSAVTDLRRWRPDILDRVIAYSGDAYRRAGRGKQVASAHGIDESRGRSYRRGDECAPLTHGYAALATCDFTTAWPAAVGGLALVTELEIGKADDETLAARRLELETIEHELEANENRATWARDDDAAYEAHRRKAEVHLELMAIIGEQRQRRRV